MKNPNSPRRLSILDATIAAIKLDREWTTARVAAVMSIPKSIIYHYFGSKADLVRAACDRYATQAREARDIAFDLAMWVAMRDDEELKCLVRGQRAGARAYLQIELAKPYSLSLSTSGSA
jgi:AcrR family transcriptional regulator